MMKLKDFDIVQDELLGKKGTPERDAFEKDVAEAVQAYKITRVRDKKRLEKVGNLVKNSYLYR